MAYAWQTVEQAAVTLGISTRTIARRIAKGELESRLNSGRREVYICLPDSASGRDRAGVETIEGELTGSDAPNYRPPEYHAEYEQTVRQTVAASAAPGADVETSTALILAEDRARRAEMAISVIQQSTAIVRDEVRVARTGARWAWGMVAALAAGVMVAVGWTTGNVTKTQQQAEAMRERMTNVLDHSERLTKEQEKLRADLERARLVAARAEGQLQEIRGEAENTRAELAAAREIAAKTRDKERQPTTRPTLGQRLANVVLGAD
jgi:hypothetical protein